MFPSDWSSDGRFLAYFRTEPQTSLDLWVVPLSGDRKPIALLHSEFNERQGQFSPDGRWMADDVYQQLDLGPGGDAIAPSR